MPRIAISGLVLAALLAGAASAVAPQRPNHLIAPPHHQDPGPGHLCSLTLVQTHGSHQLIARAAPGLTGAWRLDARSPGFRSDQSGVLSGAARVQELSHITLDARLRPAATHAAHGLRGAAPGPAAASISAELIVSDARGRVICRARPVLTSGY